MKVTQKLVNPQQAYKVWSDLWSQIKGETLQGHRLEVTVKPERRSLDQNAKFHALCQDAEKAGLCWAGAPRTAEQWKVLFVSGHATATKQGAEIVPGLEGEFVNIRESTAAMSRQRGSSLIDYTVAFLAMHGVTPSNAAGRG